MPVRQRLERIEQIPKTVHRLRTWSDPANLMADAAVARRVVHLIRAIENGTALPSGYYRKGVGLDSDDLLRTEGIMHLHLGKSNTAELLYLIQYPNDVVLLELSDHSHFASRPVGARLVNRHGAAVASQEAQLTAQPSRPARGAIKVRSGPVPKRRTKPPPGREPESD